MKQEKTHTARSIGAQGISKKYRLFDRPSDRLKEALFPWSRRVYHRAFWALKDVSFSVRRGEAFGIIGRNGSGKSTLLQIICGILRPTSGIIEKEGTLSALLELGAGFNPEFTGRSNVYMNGAVMGFSRQEMDDRMADIEHFAGIGEFIDQPMKLYSSGMYIRLAFACAINAQPDILILDEALSVGDVFFQQQCVAALRGIIEGGATCLFVSHDTTAIRNLCNRALVLSQGEVEFIGPSEEAVSRYYGTLRRSFTSSVALMPNTDSLPDSCSLDDERAHPDLISQHNILPPEGSRHGRGGIEIAALRVVNDKGTDTLEVPMLASLNFYVHLRAVEAVERPSAGIHLYDRLGNLVFASQSFQAGIDLPSLAPSEELVVKMAIAFTVQPGQYTFSIGAGEPTGAGLHDRREMLGPLVVLDGQAQVPPFYGIAQLPFSLSCKKVPATGIQKQKQ